MKSFKSWRDSKKSKKKNTTKRNSKSQKSQKPTNGQIRTIENISNKSSAELEEKKLNDYDFGVILECAKTVNKLKNPYMIIISTIDTKKLNNDDTIDLYCDKPSNLKYSVIYKRTHKDIKASITNTINTEYHESFDGMIVVLLCPIRIHINDQKEKKAKFFYDRDNVKRHIDKLKKDITPRLDENDKFYIHYDYAIIGKMDTADNGNKPRFDDKHDIRDRTVRKIKEKHRERYIMRAELLMIGYLRECDGMNVIKQLQNQHELYQTAMFLFVGDMINKVTKQRRYYAEMTIDGYLKQHNPSIIVTAEIFRILFEFYFVMYNGYNINGNQKKQQYQFQLLSSKSQTTPISISTMARSPIMSQQNHRVYGEEQNYRELLKQHKNFKLEGDQSRSIDKYEDQSRSKKKIMQFDTNDDAHSDIEDDNGSYDEQYREVIKLHQMLKTVEKPKDDDDDEQKKQEIFDDNKDKDGNAHCNVSDNNDMNGSDDKEMDHDENIDTHDDDNDDMNDVDNNADDVDTEDSNDGNIDKDDIADSNVFDDDDMNGSDEEIDDDEQDTDADDDSDDMDDADNNVNDANTVDSNNDYSGLIPMNHKFKGDDDHKDEDDIVDSNVFDNDDMNDSDDEEMDAEQHTDTDDDDNDAMNDADTVDSNDDYRELIPMRDEFKGDYDNNNDAQRIIKYDDDMDSMDDTDHIDDDDDDVDDDTDHEYNDDVDEDTDNDDGDEYNEDEDEEVYDDEIEYEHEYYDEDEDEDDEEDDDDDEEEEEDEIDIYSNHSSNITANTQRGSTLKIVKWNAMSLFSNSNNHWLSKYSYDQTSLFSFSSPFRLLNVLKLLDSPNLFQPWDWEQISEFGTITQNKAITCPSHSNQNSSKQQSESTANTSKQQNGDKAPSNNNGNNNNNNSNHSNNSGNGGRRNGDDGKDHDKHNDRTKEKQKQKQIKKKKKKGDKNEEEEDESIAAMDMQKQYLSIIAEKDEVIRKQREVTASLLQTHEALLNDTPYKTILSLAMRAIQDVYKCQTQIKSLKKKNENLQSLVKTLSTTQQPKTTPSSRKKKKAKRKNDKRNQMQAKNNQTLNYEPNAALRAQGNIRIPQKLIDKITSRTQTNLSNVFDYLDKSTAMNGANHAEIVENKIEALNFDFYDEKTNEPLYCVIESQDPKGKGTRGFKWKMKNTLFTEKELEQFNICKNSLPSSVRAKEEFVAQLIEHQTKVKGVLSDKLKTQNIINNTQWHNVEVFSKRDTNRRVTLSLSKTKLTENMKSCIDNAMDSIDLVPIVMFKNKCYFIDYIWIVRIDENVDIGISLEYRASDGKVNVTGIHVDEQSIRKQHELISPQHCNACKCLDNFISYITYVTIGNPHDSDNIIRNLRNTVAEYEKLKLFTQPPLINNKNEASLMETQMLLSNNYSNNSVITDVAFSSQSTASSVESLSLVQFDDPSMPPNHQNSNTIYLNDSILSQNNV